MIDKKKNEEGKERQGESTKQDLTQIKKPQRKEKVSQKINVGVTAIASP